MRAVHVASVLMLFERTPAVPQRRVVPVLMMALSRGSLRESVLVNSLDTWNAIEPPPHIVIGLQIFQQKTRL